jgi:Transglutaminase-like superfamily
MAVSRPNLMKGIATAIRDPASAFLISRMALWIAVLPVLLRHLRVEQVINFATPRRRPPQKQGPVKELRQKRIGELADRLLKLDLLCFTPTCWKRAIVLYRFLALAGINSQVVFGVRQSDGELKGHAWLETEDGPILEIEEPEYTRTFAHPVRPVH